MTQFLSIIERRTNDILQMYNEVFQKNAGEKSSKFNDDSISGSNFFGGSSNISELNTFCNLLYLLIKFKNEKKKLFFLSI